MYCIFLSAIQAAPSIEACPPDSALKGEGCVCDPDTCVKPPCLSTLSVATTGSDLPGSCCPIYECTGCSNDTLIDGKCPCAPAAVLDTNNQCVCVDEEKHLVNGECVCNPSQCQIPPLCDRKSVPVTVDDGCCKKTICKPCPADSESTHLETEDIEDHCVCLPCKNECGNNRTVVVKKHGTGFPGHCCDLYECKQLDEIEEGCRVDDTLYQNGEEWLTADEQTCKCQNGLSLCSKIHEEQSLSCVEEQKIYKHLEKWIKEDGCTYCTCTNGEEMCISHFCEVKESQIQKNETEACFKDETVYQHLETWTEKDGCTYCTCLNGVEKCTADFCEKEPIHKKNECQPLANCNKTCSNGFKINKKGCEICKCNAFKFTEILTKYNITMKDLLTIVEDYVSRRTSTTTTSTVPPTVPPSVEIVNTGVPTNTDTIARLFEQTLKTSTTTEPSVVPTDKDAGYWNVAIPILAVLSFACVVFIIIIVMCIYKSRRKSSIDLSHCHYETVNSINNNNTIKKTDQLL
ncbi:hypothetical protein NQ315_004384 [Exocentrus adspersus]|uniref:Antistasin-like domain-containing protein n=1 Tax=Exocentrus adspersus TaxID=1586481 RepID=A0AAV8W828_9CUCU|nr:hypothetical protein NQ315_004384 [Exocentrus adspersus]